MPETPKGSEDPTITGEETSEKTPVAKEEATAEEKLPSIEDIKGYTEDLKRRIDEAKAEKEKNIVEKIQEREVLIGEAVKNDEFLLETRGTLEYYRTMKELGELPSKEDAERLENLEKLEKTLEGREFEIKKQIYTTARHPKIKERLEKETGEIVGKRQEEKDASSKLEQVKQEARSEVCNLADGIKGLAEERLELSSKIEKSSEELEAAKEKMKKLLEPKKKSAHDYFQGKSETLEYLVENGSRTAEELEKFFELIEKDKKGTGIFSGWKDRALINFILGKKEMFKTVHEKAVELQKLRSTDNDIWFNKAEELGKNRFKIVETARQKAEAIPGIERVPRPKEITHGLHFDAMSSFWLGEKIDEFVDIKRPDPQNPEKTIGKYETMEEAEKADPRNKYLFEMHARVADYYNSERRPRGY